MGTKAESAFRTFVFNSDADKDNYDIVFKKYDDYFKPKRNVIHERAQFNLRAQKEGESVDSFIRSLYDMANHCDFGETKEEHICDKIVTGVLDKEVSHELQLKSDLTVAVATQTARQYEAVKAQLSIQSGAESSKSLDEVKKDRMSDQKSGRKPNSKSHG